MENILANAVVIDEAEDNTGRAGLGCRVRVLDLELNEEEEYVIVGSQEADPMSYRISDDSPFGRAIIGKTEGDIVEVEAPVGNLKFRIISVEK